MSKSNAMAEVVCCYQQQQPPLSGSNLSLEAAAAAAKIGPIKSKSRKTQKKEKSQCAADSHEILDQNNNNNNNNNSQVICGPECEVHSHLRFKYPVNSSSRDIEDLRELLRRERNLQMSTNQVSAEEVAFYRSDFERMMVDDWLVTRFLLRGKKSFEREASGGSETSACIGSPQARRGIMLHTLELIKVCAKFRFEHRVNGNTELSEFPSEWTRVEGLIHYKPDLVGNPTAYLRVALHRPKLIEAPEARHQFKRYMLHLLELCDRELHSKPGKAICCVFDMTNAGFENIDLELTTWMIKSFKSSSPKLLCYVLVYNAPWFFTATFKVICNTLLSTSKRQSVKFAYGHEILDYIGYDNLPPYIKSAIS